MMNILKIIKIGKKYIFVNNYWFKLIYNLNTEKKLKNNCTFIINNIH